MNIQNPSWYSSLKPISIPSSHIHAGLLNGLFPSHFPIKNLFTITFTPRHATFLTHFATVLWYTSIWQAVQIMNYTLSILLHPFPLSLIQTLFWSLCSQPEPAYKGQKALHSNKTDHKPHFILHTNYVFQHQGAILTEFITHKRSYVQHIIKGPVTLTFIIRIKS